SDERSGTVHSSRLEAGSCRRPGRCRSTLDRGHSLTVCSPCSATGARTITGAHHSPKSFGKETYMSRENVLRGSGDIGAMLATCWGLSQIDANSTRIYVQNVKARDFQPCEPFIIQGRPSIDATGYFELPTPSGFAGTP